MHPLAEELNRALDGTVAGDLLSDLGRRLYFPRGIVAQSAEAKKLAKRINATIGLATRAGKPMFLESIRGQIDKIEPDEAFPYAPTQGIEALRELWKQELARKNPDLAGKSFSMPLVVPGLTAGISILADLFAGPGVSLVLPDLHWDNYPLVFETRREARLVTFPLYAPGGGFNVAGMAEALAAAGGGRVILLLNFPNNPTGYSPTTAEAGAIVAAVAAAARSGTRILVVCDDAYFGLFYEPETFPQSLFARFCDLDPRVLAAKVDGSTKEDLTWGFRTGFITLASKGLGEPHYEALIRKLMGAVRSTVSNSSVLAQNLVLRAVRSPTYAQEKREAFEALRERYLKVKAILAARPRDLLQPQPFNSGYFMSFRLLKGKAEDLRRELLSQDAVGTIAIDTAVLRVAFSSVDLGDLEALFEMVYAAAARVAARG
ncbi:MAG TPA: aminotransferase class I/II-fold pyridoxal phosphate-dependent enzyme [Desulfobacterales bacterium]|nr:aminotransferase class I/II-fold pyridoxal phosphate-dependent enzyme [Desulfobacterales bacterium]